MGDFRAAHEQRQRWLQSEKKTCPVCGVVFRPKEWQGPSSWNQQTHCSHKCNAITREAVKSVEISHPCRNCGKPITHERKTYCGNDCMHIGRRKVVTCSQCGKEFKRHFRGARCCSDECLYALRVRTAADMRAHRPVVTHCPQGHPYDEANTYYGKHHGSRSCRACARIRAREKARAGR